LFWLLIGFLEAENIEVRDPAFSTTQTFGTIYLSFYIIYMVIVALTMLVAMMNNSFERIMKTKKGDHPSANVKEQGTSGDTNQAISSSEVELGVPTTSSTILEYASRFVLVADWFPGSAKY